MKNIRLATKMFGYLALYTIIILGLLWFFQTVMLDDFYKYIKTKEIEDSANTIAANYGSGNSEEVLAEINANKEISGEVWLNKKEVLTSYVSTRDNALKILTKADKLQLIETAVLQGGELTSYYSTQKLFNEFPKNQELTKEIREEIEDELEDLLEDGKWDGKYFDPPPNTDGTDTIIYIKTFEINGEIGAVLLTSKISPVDATINTLRTQLIYISFIMIILSLIIALIVSRQFSKPITKLSISAKELSQGNYGVEFRADGYKEIKELSDTLNYTAKELSKLEDLRRELMANISHDLRTPLTLISGYAEVMRDIPGESNSQNAQIIIDEAKRLSLLVNDVLEISKIEQGAVEIEFKEFDLSAAMEEVINSVSEMTKSKGYIIESNIEKNIIVKADKTSLMQGFYNLLANAINYTGEDKFVGVTLTEEDNQIIIAVKDTGIGISKEEQLHIWDRYYKGKSHHKRPTVGTGLGLSIVKSATLIHGGTCSVDSKEGEGSSFYIKIPRM